MMRVSGIRVLSAAQRQPDQCDPRHSDHRAVVLPLLRDARFRRHAVGAAGRDPRARHRLFGLSGGKFPRRHRGDRQGPDRGGAVDRHGLVADHAPRGAAAGGRIVLPPYGNVMIMMLKDSSQASTITVAELALAGQADRVLDLQEHQRVHAGRADVSHHEHSADPAGPPLREAGGKQMIELTRRPQELRRERGAQGHHGVRRARARWSASSARPGSGKSTILRCINGLESYDRGEISVEGLKVDRDAPSIVKIRTQVSMVFQRFNLFPHRTALENVVEGPLYVKKRAARAGARAWPRAARAGGPCRESRRTSAAALRRPAAARRDRAGAGDAAQGHPVRRADLGARSRTGRRSARRDAQARRRRHDHGRRHPRDGLCPRRRRPRAVHRRRRHRRAGRRRRACSTNRSTRARRISCAACCIRSDRSLP